MTTLKFEPAPDRFMPRLLILAGIAVAVIVVGAVWLSRPAPTPPAQPAETAAADQPDPPAAPAEPAAAAPVSPVEKDWGIRVSKLALAREGSAIDLRYEIVDPNKVGLLANGTNVAYLVDVASGSEIQLTAAPQDQVMPGTPRARTLARMTRIAGEFPPASGRIVPGKTYSALLPNPAGIVKAGSKMAFVVGKSRVDNLVVE